MRHDLAEFVGGPKDGAVYYIDLDPMRSFLFYGGIQQNLTWMLDPEDRIPLESELERFDYCATDRLGRDGAIVYVLSGAKL